MSDLYIITGSSRGLGKAIAEQALLQGDCVIGISRNLSIDHTAYQHISLDLADEKNLSEFSFNFNFEGYNRLILINNAGIIQPIKYFGDTGNNEILNNFRVNLAAPAILINQFIKYTKHSKSDRIILNISSGAATRAVDGWGCYCSSKAGLEMLTKVVAMEQEKRNDSLVIKAVAPGIVDTDMQCQIRKVDKTDFSRLNEFIYYHENNELVSSEIAAEKILNAIKNLNRIENVVFSVKE